MTSLVFVCILWSKPNVKIVQVPVSDYAMAVVKESFGDFEFNGDVLEEKVNSVKITHVPTQVSSLALAPGDATQRSLYNKIEVGEREASMDCDIRKVQ